MFDGITIVFIPSYCIENSIQSSIRIWVDIYVRNEIKHI